MVGHARARARGRRTVCAVSIATSDSGGGAGIQADLLTFAAHGVYGATVLAGATAQNTRAVTARRAASRRGFWRARSTRSSRTSRPRPSRSGCCSTASASARSPRDCDATGRVNVVLDPVMVAEDRRPLAVSVGGRGAAKRSPSAVRPRHAEPSRGARCSPEGACRGELDRRLAAGMIADLGARAVLIKGGHGRGGEVRDLLFDGRFFTEFVAPRIRTRATHGTGCTLSAAIAANLAPWASPSRNRCCERSAYLRAGLVRMAYFPGAASAYRITSPGRGSNRRRARPRRDPSSA